MTHQDCTKCYLIKSRFKPYPPLQSAVTEEFIKWVWLGLIPAKNSD